jgi:diguanylate cyclase (GGDEF)-like protein
MSRETDLVSRLGGDEFAILLSDLGSDETVGTAERSDRVLVTTRWVASRIQECLRAPVLLSGEDAPVSASIGVSIYPMDAGNEQALLEHADAAMYRSKKSGPGGIAGF